jgi:F0F1-type ATP synthase delta subunit
MTPKEKAKELVQRFIDEAYAETTEQLYTPVAKNAALIAVDEILDECLSLKEEFWEEVKQEIENL